MSENLSHLSFRTGVKKGIFWDLVEKSHSQPGAPTPHSFFEDLSARSHFGKASLFGAQSFYDYIRPEEAKVQVRVCSGTCCELAGTQKKLTSDLSKIFKAEEIGHAKCLGRCYENSAFQIGHQTFSGSDSVGDYQRLKEKKGIQPISKRLVAHSDGPAILSGSPMSASDCLNFLTQCFSNPSGPQLREVEISGLRGRGGAGFPLARKLKMCADLTSDSKFVVMNADEGDPGAFSDRYLMEQQPYRVLAGLGAAAHLMGASTAIVYVRAEYPEAFDVLVQAVDEIEKSFHELEWVIARGAGSYVCGEETALLASLEGQRPEVRVRPPYPVEQGLFLKPTVVSNVETLTCIQYILENGGTAFSQVGTSKSTGTKLVCLDSGFNRPGLYEVAMGTPLPHIFKDLGGGTKKSAKAFQLGGPLGGIIPTPKIEELTLDFESLQSHGFLLGHASVVTIPESFAMIDYLRHLFGFVADESCGKCYPCRIGSFRGHELLEAAAIKGQKIDAQLFEDLLETLELGSLCQLGGGLPLPIRNALQYFQGELETYFVRGGQ